MVTLLHALTDSVALLVGTTLPGGQLEEDFKL